MRASAAVFSQSHASHSRWGKARLRYIFTIEDIRLSCGSALLQPSGALPPTVSLTWKSGKKKAFGGVVRAMSEHEGAGARWARPVSMACSLVSNSRTDRHRFEPRRSELVLRIEGAKATRRKLVGTLDLAAQASYDRTSSKLTIPLDHGAGSLQFELTSAWLKKSALDDDDGSESMSSRASKDERDDLRGFGNDGSDESDASITHVANLPDLAGVAEDDNEEGGFGEPPDASDATHVPLSKLPAGAILGEANVTSPSQTGGPSATSPRESTTGSGW